MKRIRNEIVFGSTHRLEILNATGFILWGVILSLGANSPKNAGITIMYNALLAVMKIRFWGTLFICLGVCQLLGLFCGIRCVRTHCCGVSATIICMLVFIFGRIDIRGPFITFGTTWAVALWIAMIHDIASQEITALLRPKRKHHLTNLFPPTEMRMPHEQLP